MEDTVNRLREAFNRAFYYGTIYDVGFFAQSASRAEIGCYIFIGVAVLYFAARGLV